jgi:hypothetical protein
LKNPPRKSTTRRKTAARRTGAKALKWVAGVGVLALAIYGLTHLSNVAYTDKQLVVVDFSDLTSAQKNTALEAANTARCTCGCGMTLAQCVATDSTCPLRDGNIDRIKGMVAQARLP